MQDQYLEILQESYSLACKAKGSQYVSESFFEIFFDTYPETKKFFKGTDLDYFNGKKFKIIFDFILDVIKHPDFAEGMIDQEIVRHQMYGLNDKTYYFVLVDSLIRSIRESLGSQWTPEMEEAWTDTSYGVKHIINNAAEAFL